MYKKSIIQTIFCAIILILSLNILSVNSKAISTYNYDLILNLKHKNTEIMLYKITDYNNNFTYNFKNCNIDVSNINYDLTNQLTNYINKYNIKPDLTKSSTTQKLNFSNLSKGLYLINSNDYIYNNTIYNISPFTIMLDSNKTINVKYDQEPVTPDTDDNDKPTPDTDDNDKPTPDTDDNDKPTPDTDDNDEPTPDTDDNDEPTSDTSVLEKLPQTGQDWLFIILTSLSGIVLTIIGSYKKHKKS